MTYRIWKPRTNVLMSAMFSLVVSIIVPATVFGQASNSQNILLLSQRYNEDRFSDKIVGEVLNNSTRSYDRFDIDIYGSFYDASGRLVGSDQGFIDADTLRSGDRSAFDILITDDAIRNEAVTYDLVINDERVLEGASVGGDGTSGNDDDGAGQEQNEGDADDNDGN
jgi:hypothetical protein